MGIPDTSIGSWVKDPIQHYVAVNYKVSPDRVRALVSPQVELDTRRDAAGKEWAFASVLLFENVGFKFPAVPKPFDFLQNNYRVYIKHQGKPGVWLFRIVQGSWLAEMTRTLLKSPTYRSKMSLDTQYNAERSHYDAYTFRSESPGCRLHMEILGDSSPIEGDDLFSAEEKIHFFTQPVLGFYYEVGRKKAVSSLAVWHAPIQPRQGMMKQASAEVFLDFGVMTPEEIAQPYCLMMEQRLPDFIGKMPERRVQL